MLYNGTQLSRLFLVPRRHQPEQIAQWPSATPLHQKLYGGLEDLKKTTNFITAAGLVM